MKKHSTGFVPITFWKVGLALLIIGTVGLLFGLVASMAGWLAVPNYVLFVGGSFVIIGLYLTLVVPRE